jgi:hypothetical protein
VTNPNRARRAAKTALTRRRTRHLSALFSASLTFVRTALAMIGLVLAALRTTCLTNICAKLADCRGKLRSATHKGGGRPTDLRAVVIKADTVRHHFHVFFAKTRLTAMLALLGATDTSFEARLELLVSHHRSPVSENLRIPTAGIAAKDIPK